MDKVVTIKELTEDNPTICLSPLRVFEKCHQCPVYKARDKLKCEPHLNKDMLALMERKKKLLQELDDINKRLE